MSSRTVGLLAMTTALVCWTGFALSIRGIGTSSLTPADVAVLRFAVPLLVLSPWIPRTWRRLRTERPLVVLALCAGAAPHFVASAIGGHLTSAALVGSVIPGVVPLFVAGLASLIWRVRTSPVQLLGLLVIVAGVVVSVLTVGSGAQAAGVAALAVAGLAWSVYTLALRATGLDPVGAALTVCTACLIGALLAIGIGITPSHLFPATATVSDVVLYGLVQGVGVGVLASLGYTIAVRRLGAEPAATLSAISPVLVTLAAIPMFGERPTAATLASVGLFIAGVLVFNLAGLRAARRAARFRPRAPLPEMPGATDTAAAPRRPPSP
ncbi:DMT family transporter [Nakamurella leprariae]|uniref:DMT family transporter n=1 Tax=Nakamurella leprariae TaxID=2803911 RepID=A0A938YJD7_9ACTN|nr:DMT family transporter [Nakamurella leprariae]MBM9468875.1 DMT family transporter [Nakamurella leprariae]